MMNKIIQEVMGMYGRVYVEITNICNMNCSFCHGHRRALRRMSAEEFGHILTALTGKTGYVYYHLMGEPLTHPQLPLFLQMAKGRGFKSVITANNRLINFSTTIYIIRLNSQDLLKDICRTECLECPNLHLTETLTTKLCFTTKRLLCNERVWTI